MNSPVEVSADDVVPTESPRLKLLKSFDPPPQELPGGSSGGGEGELMQSPRSPEMFLELQAGSIDPAEQLNESALVVEELTVRNYMIPSDNSTVRVEPRGLWPNLTKLGGATTPNSLGTRAPLTMETRDDAWGLFLPQIGAHRPPLPIRRSTLTPSGFPQFSIKKGKEVAAASRTHSRKKTNQNPEIASNLPKKQLYGGEGANASVANVHREGISMREWLKQRQHKSNKAERINIFRQILELVDITHSQGLSLHSLRPSYLVILPVNQIKYIGSLVPEGQPRPLTGPIDEDGCSLERSGSKRKMNVQPEAEGNLSPKHHKVRQPDHGTLRIQNSNSGYRRQHLELGESCYPGHKSQIPAVQLSKCDIRKMEERWYASPEAQNDNICYLSSNIYNLGVLVFELFCNFDTLEAHYAAMSDLQDRILPPSFLSENPKEASLCLWLLHPDPSSRPKSRNILTCGLVCEGRDRSLLNQSSTSIDEEDAEADLLLHFLLTSKDQKEKNAAKLVADLGSVQADIVEAEKRHSSRAKTLSSARDLLTSSIEIPVISLHRGLIHEKTVSHVSMSSKKNDRLSNIDQLKNAYFSMRSKIELSETNAPARSDKDVLKIRDRNFQVRSDAVSLKESTDRLGTFFDGLCKYARYSRFEVCSTLRNVDILNSTNVICSLSFDRDEDYLAAAGVSKKIKIFEYNSILNDSIDIHYPLIEMSSRSMLSCVCWNNYIKNYLASTDYEGVVQLWDASTGQGFTKYKEHQKRAWSVDFSQTDPMKLASGSDDCSVKLWSVNEKNCVGTIRSMANICCVKFSSYSSHFLAFGSADYKLYCYDLRMTRIPWYTLSGHGKAVSYVKFIDSETLVSASTDNTLKLWDLNKTNTGGLSTDACSLTFRGHTNEKNFVGLSVSDGYIACGSETNEVYAYYKTFPMPITSHKFGSVDPITGKETGDDNGKSVSSVCWRTKSNTLVAGTSNGSMQLLKLV